MDVVELINKADDTCIKGTIDRIWDRSYYNPIEINKVIFGDEVFMRQPKIKNVIFNDRQPLCIGKTVLRPL